MYGSSLDFSSVILPGAGGGINASNAISDKQLRKENKSGEKWRPSANGMGISHHNEEILKSNAERREKRVNLVNREYNENLDGEAAMKEIFDRKRARISSFIEQKKEQYKFTEGDLDSEMLSMPLPGAFKESCNCGTCLSCLDKKKKDADFREWSAEKRKALEEGKVEGEFAGPDRSFPIAGPVDVSAAWASVGRAKNPRAVMSKIISIAKKHGWTSGLPESVKKRLEEGESGLPRE